MTIADKLNSLIDNGTITMERVAWGNGFRNVVIINGKRYQYSGKSISNILENKISLLYIDMSVSFSTLKYFCFGREDRVYIPEQINKIEFEELKNVVRYY